MKGMQYLDMKTVVMIPTYNERDNILPLVDEVLKQDNSIEVIVVDDDSPDGTWRLVEELSEKDTRVHLIHRFKRKGRGTAGVEGLQEAIRRGADYIIEMDADFSHKPDCIPYLLKAVTKYDVVIGSRFVPGGEDRRNLLRRLITKVAGIYVRQMLRLHIRDISSGYRCFKRAVLERVDLENMVSSGPSIVLELLYKIVMNGFKVGEIPIVFEDRRQGRTKLDWITLLETMVMVLRLRKMRKDGLIGIGV